MSRRAALVVAIVAALGALGGLGAIDHVTPAATVELRAGVPRATPPGPATITLCVRGPAAAATAAAAVESDLASISALAYALERATPLPQRMGAGIAATPPTCAEVQRPR
jgi:hypothetical protein